MPTSDDFRKVACSVKRELERHRLGFKTYQREHFITELNAIGASGARPGEETWGQIESAFAQEGLFIFPGLHETEEHDCVRVFCNGTRIANILNTIRSLNEIRFR